MLAGLGALLGPRSQLTVFLTRSESDCIGNLDAIAARLPLAAVYSGGRSNPFDSFDYVRQVVEEARPQALLGRVPAGVLLEAGEHSLEVIAAPLRVLTTFWAYHEATGTLFTSDSFGFRPGRALDYLLAKFDWLPGSRALDALVAEVEAVFAARRVVRVAPGHGPVLEGAALPAALDELRDALESLR